MKRIDADKVATEDMPACSECGWKAPTVVQVGKETDDVLSGTYLCVFCLGQAVALICPPR